MDESRRTSEALRISICEITQGITLQPDPGRLTRIDTDRRSSLFELYQLEKLLMYRSKDSGRLPGLLVDARRSVSYITSDRDGEHI
jgi:hypothetical protein